MDNKIKVESFKIIGISVRTTNENGQAMSDIGNLWQRFYSENILSQIPDRICDDIYSVYTDYSLDFKGEYTTILGCKVNSSENIPDGFTFKEIEAVKYIKFSGKGKLPEIVVNIWKEIWANDSTLNRKYSADFEVYSEKSQKNENAEVEIFIAVK
jgi:predicted transcriptional regulator YdeE